VRDWLSLTAILRDVPGGTVIASDALEGDDDFCDGQLAQGGSPVSVAVGNQLAIDFARCADDGPAPHRGRGPRQEHRVRAVLRSQPYLLDVFGSASPPREGGSFPGVAGADGAIALDTDLHPTEPPVDLVGGHDLRLRCASRKGDIIRADFKVP
jgi:hypothetical protein